MSGEMGKDVLGEPGGSEPSSVPKSAWLIDWAQQFLGITFAPWQRAMLEQYMASASPGKSSKEETP